MNALEWRAVGGLSLVYALRMIGMFMVLPVLALYARDLPVPATELQIGLAIGLYGLTQALLQIPLGWLSDRVGRRAVVVAGMLVFALGSFVAARADTVEGVMLGRAVQGMGAVSAAVSAWLADVTRNEVRTTAMAILGVGMGAAFILALVLGPVLAGVIGVPGLFMLTGVAAVLSLPVILWLVPVAPRLPPVRGGLRKTLGSPTLMRLNGGILLLHATMAALFVAAPLAIADTLALPMAGHWKVYLPVLLLSILPVFPIIRATERRGRMPVMFVSAIVVLATALGLMALGASTALLLLAALLLFFIAFNFLEGALPSLISRAAPPAYKGAALGVYASGQFLGGFSGGLLGGLALGWGGPAAVFAVAAALPLLWLIFAGQSRSVAVATETTTHDQ
jgi:MFS family permease